MKKLIGLASLFIALLLPVIVYAGIPVFAFTPLTSTVLDLSTTETAVVQYKVQNQSHRTHTLALEPVNGITQISTAGNCPSQATLKTGQSCVLSLQVNGAQITNPIVGGPVMCQTGANGKPNPLLCYQPAAADILNISVYQAIFYSGTQSGSVYYSTNNGALWTATGSMPGGAVDSLFVTGNSLYAAANNSYISYSTDNGNTWSHTTSPDGSTVFSVFVTADTLYAGTANGSVAYSLDGGNTWSFATPPDGSTVFSIYDTANALYAGTANGYVYYSTDNGTTWTQINGQPDGSSIASIYIANNTLFVGTSNEYVYSSTALTSGGTWTTVAQTVFSLFVDANANLFAGTQSGYVFNVTEGVELGFVTFSPISSLFISKGSL